MAVGISAVSSECVTRRNASRVWEPAELDSECVRKGRKGKLYFFSFSVSQIFMKAEDSEV